jgi:cell division transport system permease protein
MARAKGTGTSARPPLLERWAQHHARVLFDSVGRMWRNPIGTLLTAAVIGITLALPTGLHVLMTNLAAVSYSWEGTLQASVFLKDSVSESDGRALASEIGARPGVRETRYVSRQQSLEEFRSLSGFGEALDLLPDNPLPAVIVVFPEPSLGAEQAEQLLTRLRDEAAAEQVTLDQQWLQRLYALLDLFQRVVLMIAGVLAAAVIVIVGNTIRLDIEARREEIMVMKLVGASRAFIRRPFLYTGFWYGLTGALLALVLVGVAMLAISGPTAQLSTLYDGGYQVLGPGTGAILAVLAAGVGLGWAGALWTVSRHLSKIEPA